MRHGTWCWIDDRRQGPDLPNVIPSALPPKPSVLDKLLAPLAGSRDPYDFPTPRLERFGERELRLCIQRDIGWLLNDIQFAAAVPLDEVPEVVTSVLNQGLPEITGRTLEPEALKRRAEEVIAAIRAFEPRLRPETLKVEFDTRLVQSHNKLHFTIQGEIRNAVEEAWVAFSSMVDLDDGHVEVGERRTP